MESPVPTTCYRHPDRETGRRCTRCGRPACGDCLRTASVGSHCLECLREAQPSGTQRASRFLASERMLATKAIISINVAVFIFQAVRDQTIDGRGKTAETIALFGPYVHRGDWWRLLSSSVLHFGVLHLGFNMLALWLVGTMLEPGAGRIRFTTLYLVSVLAGSAGALIATPHTPVGGASGGVYGVAAAAVLAMQRGGTRFWDTGLGPLLVINLLWSFTQTNVSIGGHIGGMIGGLLVTEAMLQARRLQRPWLGYVAAFVVASAAIIVSFVAAGT